MKSNPVLIGVLIGLVVPIVILAPAFFWGPLASLLDEGKVYFLLPALALLLVPGGFAGHVAARLAPDRQAAWRFVTGLFFGSSVAAAVLLWRGAGDVDILQRFLIAVFGGPILAGFWMWLGAILGLSTGYARKEKHEPEPANP